MNSEAFDVAHCTMHMEVRIEYGVKEKKRRTHGEPTAQHIRRRGDAPGDWRRGQGRHGPEEGAIDATSASEPLAPSLFGQ